MPDGIEQKDLFPLFRQGIELIRPGAGLTTLMARYEGKVQPIGWLIGWNYSLSIGKAIEMEAIWAPWATARNKLEASVAFLHRARALGAVVIWSCRKAEARLFDHVCRYGVARTVGTIRVPADERTVFQSVEIR